jgi:iron(III) transport system substrate-binding protein
MANRPPLLPRNPLEHEKTASPGRRHGRPGRRRGARARARRPQPVFGAPLRDGRALYDGFTKATGIKINRVDADDAGIIARLKAEGSASPADVILLVDAARLWRGEHDGLFQPVRSKLLDEAIPASLRAQPAADGGIPWFGSRPGPASSSTTRCVQPADVASYEDLGDARNKGKLCIRSGSHPYNLSLFGAQPSTWAPRRPRPG